MKLKVSVTSFFTLMVLLPLCIAWQLSSVVVALSLRSDAMKATALCTYRYRK